MYYFHFNGLLVLAYLFGNLYEYRTIVINFEVKDYIGYSMERQKTFRVK